MSHYYIHFSSLLVKGKMSDSMYDVFSWMDWWMSEFHVTSMEEVQEERNPTQHSGISFMLQWHSKIRLGRPP